MEGMEGSYTHHLFSCCHRTHMHTLHVFFLSGVSGGLQLICVIAPPPCTHISIPTPPTPPSQPFSLPWVWHCSCPVLTLLPPLAGARIYKPQQLSFRTLMGCQCVTEAHNLAQRHSFSLAWWPICQYVKEFKGLHTPNNGRRTDFFTSFQIKNNKLI